MKKVILIILLMPVPAFGQIIESFESDLSGKWIQSIQGRWVADTFEALNGERSLHHIFDNTVSGFDCIGRALENLHPGEGLTRWSFLLRHGYDPSSSNNWFVFLACDVDPASLISGVQVNGYAVGVNFEGYDDTLRIWKIKDGLTSVIVKTGLNWQTGVGMKNPARLNIERTASGTWSISVTDNKDNLLDQATGTDSEPVIAGWFILNYRYSSTRDRLLWMDDLTIDGVFYEDIKPPVINSVEIIGKNKLGLTFDEEPDAGYMIPSNFFLNGKTEEAVSCRLITPVKYQVEFRGKFNNKEVNNLIINHICDRRGNCDEDVIVQFKPLWADPGDILISEIMADPLPSVSLPQKEYLEITNRSGYPVNIRNWTLSFNDEDVTLPARIIFPDEYLILCPVSDTELFSSYGNVEGLKPFPALTDDGKILVLNDSLGVFIHGLEYSSDWYGDALKEGGGWSLEIIDKDYPFFTDGNWEASSSGNGGTPGRNNSASRKNEDVFFEGVNNAFPADSNNILVTFSETVIGLDEIADNIYLGQTEIKEIIPYNRLLTMFLIKPDNRMQKGTIYSLEFPSGLKDFTGNNIIKNTFRTGIPEPAEKGDIVFNELLFNPLQGDPDYIELYNSSEKIIDPFTLYFASVNETGDTSDLLSVSVIQRCFLPGSFYAVTTDRSMVINRYISNSQENIFKIPQLPSMPDNHGHLLLLNNRAEIIDEVIYSEEMHHPLLSGNEGIAMEKIRPDINSSDPENWHSASESSGWGTPGAANSVYVADPGKEDIVTFSSGRISPDNDGYEDALVIDFNLEGTGNVLSVTIFDETGRLVKKLTENLFAGPQATLVWDGTANDGTLLNQGIYIVLIQLFNDKGKTKSWKKVCTVIR